MQSDLDDEKNNNFVMNQYPPPVGKNDLFDNPMVNAAKMTLSQEFQDKQRKLGEELFKMNFEKGLLEEDAQQVDDVMLQITGMLKAGMHPSYLSFEEKHFLECKLGEKWYEKFNYLEIDTKRINL